MRAAAARAGFTVQVDSAGTGDWHIGCAPDPRAIATAARRGIDISGLRGRQVTPADFTAFDHVVALDRRNLKDLRLISPRNATAKLSMLLDHADGRAGQDVADPYFGDEAGFETAWSDIMSGVDGMLAKLKAK